MEIYFLEVEQLSTETTTLESLLDEQYLNIVKDPRKYIIPIIYENNSQKIFYYQKWSNLNISPLATITKRIKNWLK